MASQGTFCDQHHAWGLRAGSGRLRGWSHCRAKAAALTDASLTSNGLPEREASEVFPPTDLATFLRICAGDWLSLRSRFTLGIEPEPTDAATPQGSLIAGANGNEPAGGDENSWHASERAELSVALLAATGAGHGGLALTVKGQPGQQRAYFHADGSFETEQEPNEGVTGRWTLGPDGSLDLLIEQGGTRIKERIWFTKPNLRLRSTVEQRAGESPGRASFSSEIRRVPRPPASSPTEPNPNKAPSTGAS